jgi:hypothetical protein
MRHAFDSWRALMRREELQLVGEWSAWKRGPCLEGRRSVQLSYGRIFIGSKYDLCCHLFELFDHVRKADATSDTRRAI